jgi:hypothetical protein
MGLIQMLFGARAPRAIYPMTVQLNAKILPTDRARIFQRPLSAALEAAELGKSEDGGTQTSREGEIQCVDLEVDLYENTEQAREFVKRTVEMLGAPKGSKLRISRDDVRPIGISEGLGVYLIAADPSGEVHANDAPTFVADELGRLLEGEGQVAGRWEGPSGTALYMYGSSFAEMQRRIADFLATHPLCHKCRVVQIA